MPRSVIATPDILRVAGFGVHKSLFISYARKEADVFAQHLWRRLTDAGFNVFLDRSLGASPVPESAGARST